jgi:hypothetical protein
MNNTMQCLDRFCRYELLAQKSVKTELRLKSYKVLKLQGLDCKTARTRFEIKFIHQGLELNL